MKIALRSIETEGTINKLTPAIDQSGGESQEREVRQEEKKELSSPHDTYGLSRKFQEIIDN